MQRRNGEKTEAAGGDVNDRRERRKFSGEWESEERDRGSQRMELVGPGGYYGMKAINECEGTGRWRIVCLCVCIIRVCLIRWSRLSRTSVTCRVFNKVSMLGVLFAPRRQRVSLREPSHT